MSDLKQEIQGLILILTITFFLGLSVNRLSPRGIPLKGKFDSQKNMASLTEENILLSDIEINNPFDVKKIVNDKKMLLVDVRPEFIYEQGHIPDAISLPLNEFEQSKNILLSQYSLNHPILIYCSGPKCTDSHTFAKKLRRLGFTGVKVYRGGFLQWLEMEFEIE